MYIAGPAFGARQAAGNSVEDIAGLCAYAHRFGCRIYVTLNTILFDNELEDARKLLNDVIDAGADAVIVQDPAVLSFRPGTILHASTQCAIRTPEKAAYLESLGFGRLILERQLSLKEIKAIREATSAELEFFVHGALCVSYSGNCYLSENITGRSANRGACVQACRSLYDLTDSNGRVLGRNKAYLSLKDLMLLDRLEDLADAGIDSFKIEGRLKNSSYVRSVVKTYSAALDALVRKHPNLYRRASFGHSSAAAPATLDKTFNRGYTQLYLDGKKGQWASLDTPKSMGEAIGKVKAVKRSASSARITVEAASPGLVLSNGDGFAFVRKDGGIGGFRGFRCSGMEIECRGAEGLEPGMTLYRNLSMEFERSVAAERVTRSIDVSLDVKLEVGSITLIADSEDGRMVKRTIPIDTDLARDAARMEETVKAQLGKRSCVYAFTVRRFICDGPMPFLGISALNQVRRDIAAELDGMPVKALALDRGHKSAHNSPAELDYTANAANRLSRELYASTGTVGLEPAYELTHRPGAELMRSRYCLRHELGMCPGDGTPLYLHNNGRTLTLEFHCRECEMVVKS
ncbi:MAG: DUF3656 domain-containing protein [Bacteroidales bacterium]|nr:DUF3656 domain-containing protein [Bacteroidales bacterium]